MKLRNLLQPIFAAVFLFAAFAASAADYYFEENGIRYAYQYVQSTGGRDYSKCTVVEKENGKYKGDIVIPEKVQNGTVDVVSVNSEAFKDCTELTSVILPNSVLSIGIRAFKGCSSLVNVDLGDGVEEIDGSAGISGVFEECNSLKSITIPNKVEEIPEDCFAYCSSLEKVVLGDHLRTIENNAFYNCLNISEITSLNPTPPSIYSNSFDSSLYEKATVRVPVGRGEVYRNSYPYWTKFANIVETDFGGVGDVANDAVSVTTSGGNIVLNGMADGTAVEIYNIGGQLVYSGQSTTIGGLERGIYIVRTGGQAFKVAL